MYISPAESQCLHDKNFLLTKVKVMKKLQNEMGLVHKNLKDMSNHIVDQTVKGHFKKAGKISKGENYLDLPYLILDYPRTFKSEEIFAFRTMFWWGNFLSSTLHLQGKTLEIFKARISKSYNLLAKENFHICVNTTPWEYHYEDSNYLLISDMTEERYVQKIAKMEFLKLSRKIELNKLDTFDKFTEETLKIILKTLNIL